MAETLPTTSRPGEPNIFDGVILASLSIASTTDSNSSSVAVCERVVPHGWDVRCWLILVFLALSLILCQLKALQKVYILNRQPMLVCSFHQ
jgi:hypothetical protein